MERKIIFYENGENKFEVAFDYDILNIHIENSHNLSTREDIVNALTYIHSTEEYKELIAAGYTRTTKSQINEWLAHSRLWNWGYKRNRTGSVDLDQNESKFRKFIYFILTFLG